MFQDLIKDNKIKKSIFLTKDSNKREIFLLEFNDVFLTGSDLFYPNCRFKTSSEIINPIDEQIMSLKGADNQIKKLVFNTTKKVENTPLFYFVYNTDNYYHFVYDTLPYLISFFHLKQTIPNIKLLMNYPNVDKKNFYPFVLEFLNLLNIFDNDIVLASPEVFYKKIIVSSSYTHGIDSNIAPRKEIYDLYHEIRNRGLKVSTNKPTYKKIYISRRFWKHNDFANIGTNYTLKRKCMNENELVDILSKKGYQEIFTENLSLIEKIHLFANVDSVVGAIGGGSCNVLFSKPSTKHYCIVSPTFLKINKRFIHSLGTVDTKYFYDTYHEEIGSWKKHMRIKSNDIIGEIEEIYENNLLVSYTDSFVAGWNSAIKFKKILLPKQICTPLDNGLNSRWSVNINKFSEIVDS